MVTCQHWEERPTKKQRLEPLTLEELIPADQVPANVGGPLTPVNNINNTGKSTTKKVHLLKQDGQAVGGGWKPRTSQITQLDEETWASDVNLQSCQFCFRMYSLPLSWTQARAMLAAAEAPSSSCPSSPTESASDVDSGDDVIEPCLPVD